MLSKEIREKVKSFIIYNVEAHPNDIASLIIEKFGISRPAALNHINKLITEKIIEKTGEKRNTKYKLFENSAVFFLKREPDLAEHVVFNKFVKPSLPDGLPENVNQICNIVFSEIFNNAIDHSEASEIMISITYDALKIRIAISDNGVGIFNKIQKALNLDHPQHAILELAKGKLTTAPQKHSGEGIFFSSRMVNHFLILSGGLAFYGHKNEDVIFDHQERENGTYVVMMINRNSTIDAAEVYSEYAAGDKDDYAFSRTIVPVKLMQYEGEILVSRSQAKRLIARFERFREVVLDFEGVKLIGQAFADEVFRVFQNEHPNVNLMPINSDAEVSKMILHVKVVNALNGGTKKE